MALYFSISPASSSSSRMKLVAGHLSEGKLKLLSDGLVLLHFSGKFIFQPINLMLELLDRFFSKLSSGLSLLQLASECLDLLLVGVLTLVGLLLGNFQGLQVVGNNSQFFLEFHDFSFTILCPLLCSLKVSLTLSEPLCNFFILGISIFCLCSGFLEIFF